MTPDDFARSWAEDQATRWLFRRLLIYLAAAIGSGALFVLGAYIYSLTT